MVAPSSLKWYHKDSKFVQERNKRCQQVVKEVRLYLADYIEQEGLIKYTHLDQKYSIIEMINIMIKKIDFLTQIVNVKNPSLQKMFEMEKEKYENKLSNSILEAKKELEKGYKDQLKKIEKYYQSLNSSLNSTLNPQDRGIFIGQLLHREEDYKQYVIRILEKFTKQNVMGSSLLYRMDLLNPTNFHKYIDNHPNLLIVVKLKNEFMLAVFHEDAISNKMISNQKGLIFSLTNRRCFRNTKRAVTYDLAHLIIGNSEIRIMNGKDKIFSNFGVNNGYYERNGYDVDVLLGEGKTREVEMSSYEVLEVFFK